MSTATTTSLSDTLPASVPKLEPDGSNWVVFVTRFTDAVEAKGFFGHFDGTTPRPPPVVAADKTSTDVEGLKWDKDERAARSLLTQKLPDSALMLVHNVASVSEHWKILKTKYTEKGAYARTYLRRQFLQS